MSNYCQIQDPETPCSIADPHLVCFRKHGGRTMDPFAAVTRQSDVTDEFWETGEAEVFDRQINTARANRQSRLTRMEHVRMD